MAKSSGPRGLYHCVRTASVFTDRVLVAFSGGKDSVATLDLCCRHFSRVEAFFMYYVPGLSFQESMIRWAELKYGVTVHRVPHFELSEWLRYGTLRRHDLEVPVVKVRHVYNYLREMTGIYWIAAGERIADSVWRRAMIKKSSSIDAVRGRLYPVAEWTKADVLGYVRQRKLRISPESSVLGFSFRSLQGEDMAAVHRHYPADYARIKEWFPLVDASRLQWEYFYGQEKE